MVNDTNTHVGQTLFAPTNEAFEKLGTKTERFLFSRAGKPYLKALLKGQIVANHTLLTDIYFPHGGLPQQTLDHGSQVSIHGRTTFLPFPNPSPDLPISTCQTERLRGSLIPMLLHLASYPDIGNL